MKVWILKFYITEYSNVAWNNGNVFSWLLFVVVGWCNSALHQSVQQKTDIAIVKKQPYKYKNPWTFSLTCNLSSSSFWFLYLNSSWLSVSGSVLGCFSSGGLRYVLFCLSNASKVLAASYLSSKVIPAFSAKVSRHCKGLLFVFGGGLALSACPLGDCLGKARVIVMLFLLLSSFLSLFGSSVK